MKKLLLALLLLSQGAFAQEINVVPYPSSLEVLDGRFTLKDKIVISVEDCNSQLAQLFADNLTTLTAINPKISNNVKKGDICFITDSTLAQEEYKINVLSDKIELFGRSYSELSMASVTLLQMIDRRGADYSVVCSSITDSPEHSYRAVMLDVARQWIDIETVKQTVDLCYWYKMPYLQLHLSDDQSFTFPSESYPKLTTKGHSYTKQELVELVEYAKVRGVIIIPELDAPGHTSSMRKEMPELFGEPNYYVIDIAREETCKAVETIAKEIMDVFYTSPYFHIGADEAWFAHYAKVPHVKEYIKEKGYDSVHDIYLEFIARMHSFVKSCGKKTMAWESFGGNGSRKVTIPNDLIMFAWETAFQRPESLLKNGYKIINASWKPTYLTPSLRWSPEYIYNWNIRRWENHWNVTPAYKNPINIEPSNDILGGQMCVWEMGDKEIISSIHNRVPAISEVIWNDSRRSSFAEYNVRYENANDKFKKLTFPAYITRKGFYMLDDNKIDDTAFNYFGDKAEIKVEPMDDQMSIRYTTDGTKPTLNSKEAVGKILLEKSEVVTFAIFDKNGEIIGYKTDDYKLQPIVATLKGAVVDYRDRRKLAPKEVFDGILEISLNSLKKGGEIRYTIDGTKVTASSSLYSEPISINSSTKLNAQYFIDGKAFGNLFSTEYVQRDYEKNITTGAKITTNSPIGDDLPQNAVDGVVDINQYWGAGKSGSLTIDLGREKELSKAVIYTYWDGRRYYQYDVEISTDGKIWKKVVDRTENSDVATSSGYSDNFARQNARYLRLNMIKNSANNAVHVVEVRVY